MLRGAKPLCESIGVSLDVGDVSESFSRCWGKCAMHDFFLLDLQAEKKKDKKKIQKGQQDRVSRILLSRCPGGFRWGKGDWQRWRREWGDTTAVPGDLIL